MCTVANIKAINESIGSDIAERAKRNRKGPLSTNPKWASSSSTASLPSPIFKTSFCRQTHHARLGFLAVHARRSSGSGVSAKKRPRKGRVVTDDDSDDDEVEFELNGSDDEFERQEEDDDEGAFVPFEKMKKWLKTKPRGFGEGKEYDISIEEKLLEEIEKSKKAQAESDLAKLSEKPNSKGDQSKNSSKVSVTSAKIQKQIKCELVDKPALNLDKIQSTHNRSALPLIVSGLEEDHKADFDLDNCSMDTSEETILDEYEGSDVEIDGPELEDAIKQSSDNHNARRLTVSELEEDQKADSDLDDSSLETWEESIVDEYDGSDFELDEPELEDSIENPESISGSDLDGRDRDSMESWTESESLSADSFFSNQLLVKAKEEKLPRQKPVVKGKVESSPKKKKKQLTGGSSKRLKVKEKAVLGDVFAKYGSKEELTSSAPKNPCGFSVPLLIEPNIINVNLIITKIIKNKTN